MRKKNETFTNWSIRQDICDALLRAAAYFGCSRSDMINVMLTESGLNFKDIPFSQRKGEAAAKRYKKYLEGRAEGKKNPPGLKDAMTRE